MLIEPYVATVCPDMCSMDFTGHWQPGEPLRAMQRAASAQCSLYGLSYQDLSALGLAWVVTRAHVRMDEYPAYGEGVEVTTWPGTRLHGFYPRHFTFAVHGRIVGRATALYVVLDLKERRIAAPGSLPADVPECSRPAPLPFPAAVRAAEPETRAPYTPRYRDVDMNGHINNTRYVDWLCDQFPCDRHAREEIGDLLVNYQHEARPDEPLELRLHDADGRSVMRGLRDGVCLFSIEAAWRPRAGRGDTDGRDHK